MLAPGVPSLCLWKVGVVVVVVDEAGQVLWVAIHQALLESLSHHY
jgi:hypothetical protein